MREPGSRKYWLPGGPRLSRCGIVVLLSLFCTELAPIDGASLATAGHEAPVRRLLEYRRELQAFREEFSSVRPLPRVDFFLFGMGSRAKLLYRSGSLSEATSGKVIRKWSIESEIIVPPDYSVFLTTTNRTAIGLLEDAQGVWIEEDGKREIVAGTQAPVNLPTFGDRGYPQILRVLHQELLVNVIDGKPVPNFFVYPKPWYRDGAMMAMCFRETGNLDLIREWVLGLKEPYDRNNSGETEADNLGQALYLISLVADKDHPLVPRILNEFSRFEVQGPEGIYLKGRSDFAEHPAYQTKWAKFGLAALNLPDSYGVPRIHDSYSALFWWDFRENYVRGMDADDKEFYPYLGWACDHFHGTKGSPLSDLDYPLTWEQEASRANYEGMRRISEQYTRQRLAAPHTWHAAEAFLYLLSTTRTNGQNRLPDPTTPADR